MTITVFGRWGGSKKSRDGVRGSFSSAFTFSAIGSLANALVALVSGIATARIYGVATIGSYAVAYAPTAAVWYLSSVREQPALVRELTTLKPREPRATALFASVFIFSEALTLAVSLTVGVISYYVLSQTLSDPQLAQPAIAMLAGYAILANPGWNIDSVFAGFRAAKEVLWARLGQATSFLLFAMLASAFSSSVWSLTAALILSYGTALVHRIILTPRYLTIRISRSDFHDGFRSLPAILRFGLRATPGTLAAGVSGESGTWVLAAMSTVSSVGAWSRAAMFSSKLIDISSRVGDMLLPTLVERRSESGDEAYDRALIDSIRYLATLLLLPAAVGGGAAEEVMRIFGPGFGGASTALAIALLFPVVSMTISMQAQALLAEGRPLATTATEISRMAVTLGVSLVVSWKYGIVGPACGLVIGGLVDAFLQYRMVRHYLRRPPLHWWPVKALLTLAAAYSLAFACSHVSKSLLPGYAGLATAFALGTGVYIAVIACGAILDRDRDRFTELRANRPAKPVPPTT